MSSASSLAFLMASVVASILTTTPWRIPVLGLVPTPTMSILFFEIDSLYRIQNFNTVSYRLLKIYSSCNQTHTNRKFLSQFFLGSL
jgi:hypothetical protein